MKVKDILREQGVGPKDYSPDINDLGGQKYQQAWSNNPWQASIIDQPTPFDFEVQLKNPLTQQQINFILRPQNMLKDGQEITPDTFDVRDLQTGQTTEWESGWGMPLHHGAAWMAFYDDAVQKQLRKILAYYIRLGRQGKNPPAMPGRVGAAKPAGISYSAQDAIDSGVTDPKDLPDAVAANKASAAISKAKNPRPGIRVRGDQ